MPISSVALQTTETTLCQAGVTEKRAVLSITFCNTTTADHTLTMYAYISTGSASDSTTMIKTLTISALDSFLWSSENKFIVMNSDKMSALCDLNNSITATVNYYVF